MWLLSTRPSFSLKLHDCINQFSYFLAIFLDSTTLTPFLSTNKKSVTDVTYSRPVSTRIPPVTGMNSYSRIALWFPSHDNFHCYRELLTIILVQKQTSTIIWWSIDTDSLMVFHAKPYWRKNKLTATS